MGTARQGQYRWIRKSNTFQRLCVGNRNMGERNRYCQNTFKSTEVPQSQFTKTFKRSAKFSPIFKVFHGFENSCQKSRTLRTFEDCQNPGGNGWNCWNPAPAEAVLLSYQFMQWVRLTCIVLWCDGKECPLLQRQPGKVPFIFFISSRLRIFNMHSNKYIAVLKWST